MFLPVLTERSTDIPVHRRQARRNERIPGVDRFEIGTEIKKKKSLASAAERKEGRKKKNEISKGRNKQRNPLLTSIEVIDGETDICR
jgi:hypothetical protein